MDGFSTGLSVKSVSSKIIDTASTVAFDVGLLSPLYLGDRLRLALTGVNIGGSMKFDETSEDLPMAIRLGSSYKITERWITSLDLASPNDNDAYVAFGTEYVYPFGETCSLAGRLGLNTRTASDVEEDMGGLSFGRGFMYKDLSVDLYGVPFGELGEALRFSLSFDF